MKHIKRKFLKSIKLDFDPTAIHPSVEVPETTPEKFNELLEKSYYPITLTENNELIQCFIYTSNRKHFVVPEPNLISVYFDIAQSQNRHIKMSKAELLTNIDINGDVAKTLNKSYAFFESSAIGVFFLYTAVDAFSNLILPSNKAYIKKGDRGDLHFTHEQMQKGLSLEEKIKEVIPHFTGKYFHQEYGHKYETIIRIKHLRDEIAHTKAYSEKNGPNYYKDIFTRLLDFNFEKGLEHARDFINYYDQSLIEECGCGRPE